MIHLQRNSKIVGVKKHFIKSLHKFLHITKECGVSKAKSGNVNIFLVLILVCLFFHLNCCIWEVFLFLKVAQRDDILSLNMTKRGYGDSIPGDYQKLNGHGPVQPALVDPALSRGLRPGELQRSLPSSAILRFWDLRKKNYVQCCKNVSTDHILLNIVYVLNNKKEVKCF